MPEEMARENTVCAIVLAAGMSSRMGKVKQLLRLDGTLLLDIALDHLRASEVDEIVVVLGFEAETIRREARLAGTRVVLNEAYRDGMATSLAAGLAAAGPQVDAALIVLADQPFVQPSTINRLIAQYCERKPQIAVPVFNGFRGNPVLLDRSVFPELLQLSGDIGCRAIFGSHAQNILKVPVDDAGVLVDVDTMEDFERAQHAPAAGDGAAVLLETADLEGRDVGGPQLVIVGWEPVAGALAQIANLLHYDVTVVDAFLDPRRAPGVGRVLHALDFSHLPMTAETVVVIASRGRFDEEAIEQALATDAGYLALVAGKKRVREILARLEAKGTPKTALERLHAPAGLEIGAESDEEIALSIMAEVVSWKRRPPRNV
jgi:molybdenum cofactor cytidylyltransferase